MNAAPIIDGNGEILGAVGIFQDITWRKQAERALRESEQKYRRIAELAQEGIWVIDAKGLTTYVNPRMEQMLGYAPGEMMGQHHFAFMDEKGNMMAERHLERRKQGITEEIDLEFITKDGARIITTLTTSPVLDAEGNYAGALAVVADVTDRRRAADALQESEERFRGIFERAGIGIVLADTRGNILRTNPAFQRIIGYSADELQGRSIADFTHPEDVGSALLHFQETLAGKHDEDHMEKRYVRKDGRTVWGRLATTLLRDSDGEIRFVIGMIEDITERKENEALRKRAFEQIEHNMEQFAILGDHVRHPLQVLLARADLMEDKDTAEKIREQVLRINALVRQLDQGWMKSREIREFLRRNELV